MVTDLLPPSGPPVLLHLRFVSHSFGRRGKGHKCLLASQSEVKILSTTGALAWIWPVPRCLKGLVLSPHFPLILSKSTSFVGGRGDQQELTLQGDLSGVEHWASQSVRRYPPHPCTVLGDVLDACREQHGGASGACHQLLRTNMGCMARRIRTRECSERCGEL